MIKSQTVRDMITAVNAIAFVGFCAVGLTVGGWIADRSPPRSDLTGRLVSQNPHKPGSLAVVEYEATFNRDCQTILKPRIVAKGVSILLDSRAANTEQFRDEDEEMPFRTTFQTSFIVPMTAQPGTALFSVEAGYFCNPIQQLMPIYIEWPAIQFEVAEGH